MIYILFRRVKTKREGRKYEFLSCCCFSRFSMNVLYKAGALFNCIRIMLCDNQIKSNICVLFAILLFSLVVVEEVRVGS